MADTIDDDDEIDGADEPFVQEAEPEPIAECPIAAQVSLLQAWLAFLTPDTHVKGLSGRVQFAYDQMHISVCERVARMARSDIEGGDNAGTCDR